jgi:hypothetical protein
MTTKAEAHNSTVTAAAAIASRSAVAERMIQLFTSTEGVMMMMQQRHRTR